MAGPAKPGTSALSTAALNTLPRSYSGVSLLITIRLQTKFSDAAPCCRCSSKCDLPVPKPPETKSPDVGSPRSIDTRSSASCSWNRRSASSWSHPSARTASRVGNTVPQRLECSSILDLIAGLGRYHCHHASTIRRASDETRTSVAIGFTSGGCRGDLVVNPEIQRSVFADSMASGRLVEKVGRGHDDDSNPRAWSVASTNCRRSLYASMRAGFV